MEKKYRNRLPFALTTILLSAATTAYATQDQDGDGLSDEFELAHGLDPNSFDSDVDGLSDYSQYKHLLFDDPIMLNSVSTQVPDAPDVDGDGLHNFLETYGFYIVDGEPASVPRHIPADNWNADKQDPTEFEGVRVFELALNRLEQDGRARLDPNEPDTYLVNLEGAKNAIVDAFANAGLSPTSTAIEGSTREHGSAANIIQSLLEYPRINPVDAQGEPLPVFVTDPDRASSDLDPFTDYDEAMGIFNGGRPEAPADHPLFAAAPEIQVDLESFEVIFVEQNRNTLGESNSELKGKTLRKSRSHSHGLSIGLKVEWGVSPDLLKKSVEVKQDNSVSFGSATTLEQRNTFSTYIQNSTNTQSDCFAKLDMNLLIKNAGYATASNITLAFNVYLGNSDLPWETLVVDSSNISNLTLTPGESRDYAVAHSDQTCLTIDETNYLAQGGTISIETVVADATVDFYDDSKKLVVSGGSWQTYNNLIKKNLAKLHLDVNAEGGKQINHTLYYYTPGETSSNLRLTVEEALATAFTPTACDASLNENTRCFLTHEGDLMNLGPNTYLDVVFFNNQGISIDDKEMRAKYSQLPPVDNNDPFAKILPVRSAISIINNDYEVPQFTHIELINLLQSEVGGSNGIEVRATVNDFFGVADVFFCFNEGHCQSMQNIYGESDIAPHSGLFSISLPEYSLTGNEFVKAINNIGNESPNQTPEALFMSMHGSLANIVDDYFAHFEILQARVDALSALQTNNASHYESLINSGYLTETGLAQAHLNALKGALEASRSACNVSLGEDIHSIIENFQSQRDACLSQINAVSSAVESREVKIFDINALPANYLNDRYIGRTKAGRDRGTGNFGANNSRDCRLGDNQYAVGIGMGKKNDKSTGVYIQLHYLEYDPVSRSLSALSQKDCGSDFYERETILDFNQDELEAELILDVGAELKDNITAINGKGARWINRLCVSYRKFNFSKGEWIGERKFRCDNSGTSQSISGEARTGLDLKNNDSYVLKGLTVYHSESKTVSNIKEMFGEHAELRANPNDRPLESLSEFGQYHIVNDATGEFLTVMTSSAESAALGMDTLRFDDSQIWTVERLNDREVMLVPQAFPEGAFTKNPTLSPSVAALGNEAAPQFDFNKRLIMRKQNATANSPYLIQSVVDHSYLAYSDDQLNWKNVTSFTTQPGREQQWILLPVTNTPEVQSKESVTFTVNQSTPSPYLFNACQIFELGGEYHIEKVKVITSQSSINKSHRLVFLNETDHFSKFLYPPNTSANFTGNLGALSNRSERIEICNGFVLTPPGSTNWPGSLNDSSWLEYNRVNSIEVTAVPAD